MDRKELSDYSLNTAVILTNGKLNIAPFQS